MALKPEGHKAKILRQQGRNHEQGEFQCPQSPHNNGFGMEYSPIFNTVDVELCRRSERLAASPNAHAPLSPASVACSRTILALSNQRAVDDGRSRPQNHSATVLSGLSHAPYTAL